MISLPSQKFARQAELLVDGPAVLALFLLMIHVTVNAIARTYLSNTLSGTLERTEYWYLPMIAFLGLVAAQRSGDHIEARLIFNLLPTHLQRYTHIGTQLVFLLATMVLAYTTLTSAIANFQVGLTAGRAGIVIWPATFLPPLAFVSLGIYVCLDLSRQARKPSP